MSQININQINLDGQITQEELFDGNGKIKSSLMPISPLIGSYKCTSASDTPNGVEWFKDGTKITGTLSASATTTSFVYFVPNGVETYKQYMTFVSSTDGTLTYYWECINSGTVAPTAEIIEHLNRLDSSVSALEINSLTYVAQESQ